VTTIACAKWLVDSIGFGFIECHDRSARPFALAVNYQKYY